MPLLALWVVTSPFAAGTLIGSSVTLRGVIGRHYFVALALGWAALLFVVVAILVIPGDQMLECAIAAPLAGLSFWRHVDGPDDEGPETDDPEPPDGDVDWDEFQRELDRWVRARRRPLVHS
jgi:hypothetical protein